MKLLFLVVLGAAVAFVSAAPQEVTVVKSESDLNEDGSFRTLVELSDGTLLKQSGTVKNPQEPDPEKRIIAVEGEYIFTDPSSGQKTDVKYVADENGYQPTIVSRK